MIVFFCWVVYVVRFVYEFPGRTKFTKQKFFFQLTHIPTILGAFSISKIKDIQKDKGKEEKGERLSERELLRQINGVIDDKAKLIKHKYFDKLVGTWSIHFVQHLYGQNSLMLLKLESLLFQCLVLFKSCVLFVRCFTENSLV